MSTQGSVPCCLYMKDKLHLYVHRKQYGVSKSTFLHRTFAVAFPAAHTLGVQSSDPNTVTHFLSMQVSPSVCTFTCSNAASYLVQLIP